MRLTDWQLRLILMEPKVHCIIRKRFWRNHNLKKIWRQMSSCRHINLLKSQWSLKVNLSIEEEILISTIKMRITTSNSSCVLMGLRILRIILKLSLWESKIKMLLLIFLNWVAIHLPAFINKANKINLLLYPDSITNQCRNWSRNSMKVKCNHL